MQRWTALTLGLVLVFAGCLGEEGEVDDSMDDGDDGAMEPQAPLPPPIADEQQVTGQADPLNFVTNAPCNTPGSCTEYPFTAETSVRIEAALTWTMDQSDFDLYLYEGEEQVAISGNTPPGTEEAISTKIGPGEYRLIVVAWAVSQDTYTISATFSYA